MSQKRNIAARVGGWSIRHRKTAVFGWLAFVIAAFVVGTMVVGQTQLKDTDQFVGESGRAAVAVDTKMEKNEGSVTERVLIHSSTMTVSDPRFADVVRDVAARVSRTDVVKNVVTGVDDGEQ